MTIQADPSQANPKPVAVILAAGKGVRMQGQRPKVVYEVGGRPMILPVIETCRAAGCERIIVVVGYGQEQVRRVLEGTGVEFAVQAQQLGTGHAVRSAESNLAHEPEDRPVFVLCGDGPLIRAETLGAILERHTAAGASATLATAVLDDPTGYGRIERDEHGRFLGIVEQRNCTPQQLNIREVNPSYYCFARGPLFDALSRLSRNEVSNEYYVTDVPGILLGDGARVEVLDAVPPDDVLSINTPEELARVDEIYRRRVGALVSGDEP